MMALHDRDVVRTMAFGIGGLSAIEHAKVKPVRNEDGLVVDYETTGEFPVFGNNDARVDDIGRRPAEALHGQAAAEPDLSWRHHVDWHQHPIRAPLVY